METSLKIGFAQIFSCCPKNLSCPNFGGAAAPLAPPARTPMLLTQEFENGKKILSTNKMVKKLTRQTGIFWIIWATWTNLNTYSLSRRIIDEKSSLFTLLRRLYCKNLREVKKESKKIKYINLLSGYILVYKCFLIECISWTEYIRSK